MEDNIFSYFVEYFNINLSMLQYKVINNRWCEIMEKQQLIEIGLRLRERRTELKFTREKMAELSDIGTGYYGQLEVGTSQMSIDTLIKLSKSMHLNMNYIIFGEQEETGDSSAIIELLNNCTARELKLAEEVLKLFLLKQ